MLDYIIMPCKRNNLPYLFNTIDKGYYQNLRAVADFYALDKHKTELVIRDILKNLKGEFVIAAHEHKGSLITGTVMKINKQTIIINNTKYKLDDIMIYHPSIIAACSLYV